MARLLVALGVVASTCRADGTGNGVSKSTYAATDPIPAATWLKTYLPVEEANDDCDGAVCHCSAGTTEAWDIEQGRVALKLGFSDLGISRGFGLHLVNVSARTTGPELSLAAVEAAFAARLGNMSDFDAFMDFNVGLFTTDLTRYTDRFDADGVPYLLLRWTVGAADWFSAVALVPRTSMVLELISTNYTARGVAAPLASEARSGAAALAAAAAAAAGPSRDFLYPIRVGRAATSLAAVDAFYASAFPAATKVIETATRHCYKFENASTVDVCYSEHGDDAAAPLSVADLERGVRAGHDATLAGQPKCGLDKWLDFHLAYDNPSHASTAAGDALVAYVDETDGALFACEANPRPSGPQGLILHYVVDPTGWGIQYGGPYSVAPRACTAGETALRGDANPACDLGTCA